MSLHFTLTITCKAAVFELFPCLQNDEEGLAAGQSKLILVHGTVR